MYTCIHSAQERCAGSGWQRKSLHTPRLRSRGHCLSSSDVRASALTTSPSNAKCQHLSSVGSRLRLTQQRPRTILVKAARPSIQQAAERTKAHAVAFGVQAVFALWYIIGKVVLSNGNDPLTFAMLRELLSAGALLGLAQYVEGDLTIKSKEDLVDFVVLGCLCYGNIIGFMFALSEISEVQVAIAQPLVPAIALGMSALAGMEKLSVISGVGIVISISGAIAFSTLGQASGPNDAGTAIGYAELALEVICYAGQLVWLPRLSSKYKPFTLTAIYYSVSTVASITTLLVRERDNLSKIVEDSSMLTSASVQIALIYAVFGATVFCFTAMGYSSKRLKPSITSAYITLQPIMVAALSVGVFGRIISFQELEAGGLVVLGLYFTIIGNPRMDEAWRDYLSDLPTNLPATIAELPSTISNTATVVAEKATVVAEKTTTAISEARDAVDDKITDASEYVTDVATEVLDVLIELEVEDGEAQHDVNGVPKEESSDDDKQLESLVQDANAIRSDEEIVQLVTSKVAMEMSEQVSNRRS